MLHLIQKRIIRNHRYDGVKGKKMKKGICILAAVMFLFGIILTVYFIYNKNVEKDNLEGEIGKGTNDYIIRFYQDSRKIRDAEKEICIPKIKFLDRSREKLENRINETIYSAATAWMDYKFIKMNTEQIETGITCHNSKYISISLCYYLKANRSKIINNYIVVDLTSGKRLFLKDFVDNEKQLISRMREGENIYADTNAFALEQEEANNQLKSLLMEEPENDLREMLNQCSMEEKTFPLIYEDDQTLPTLFEKSGFYIEGESIVIDYGKYDHTRIHFEGML